jgi:putative membrane protein
MLHLDLTLAILHHVFVFALFGILFAELVVVRLCIDVTVVRRVVPIDASYGVLAALILIVGFSRAIFAAKGWTYYAHNAFFWAKLGTFAAIGLLSIQPTLAFLRWRRADAPPADEAVARTRRFLWLEVALFPLLLAFAAAMARGYGMF